MYVDCHRHYTSGSQEELFEELSADGFDKTLLFGYNGMKLNGAVHSQDLRIMEIFKYSPQKIIPFLCDFDFEDQHIEKYISDNLESSIFRGVGEILIGHSAMKNTFFKNISYSDQRVIKVFKSISEFEVPIIVHVDIPFVEDFTKALKECSNCRFIYAHAMYDFTTSFGGVENKPEILEAFLNRFENLYFDISMWKISPVFFMQDSWLDLFEKYNDRFMYGTDMTDHYNIQSVWTKAYESIFSRLSVESATKITNTNILKLCKLF